MPRRRAEIAGVLLACLGALAACRRSAAGIGDPGVDAGSSVPAHVALRDDARLVLERHCGECHVRDNPAALPRALAVYDLREPEWAARMSDTQLRAAEWRLGEPLPPDGRPSEATPEERAQLQRYVDAEIVRRDRLARDGGDPSSR